MCSCDTMCSTSANNIVERRIFFSRLRFPSLSLEFVHVSRGPPKSISESLRNGGFLLFLAVSRQIAWSLDFELSTRSLVHPSFSVPYCIASLNYASHCRPYVCCCNAALLSSPESQQTPSPEASALSTNESYGCEKVQERNCSVSGGAQEPVSNAAESGTSLEPVYETALCVSGLAFRRGSSFEVCLRCLAAISVPRSINAFSRPGSRALVCARTTSAVTRYRWSRQSSPRLG